MQQTQASTLRRRLLGLALGLIAALGINAPTGAAFVNISGAGRHVIEAASEDSGPTRYTATHHVRCDASGSGNGLTYETAWTPTQAKAAVAGNIVQWHPGSGGLCQFAPTGNDDGAWAPTNSGTSGSPIIHYASYAATFLSTPTSNANRTELSHSGNGTSNAQRSAIIDSGGQSNVIFDGFLVNWANAKPAIDGGWFNIGGQAGGYENVQILNTYIQAAEDTIGGNYPAVWVEGVDGFVFSGNVVRDLSSSTDTSQNVAAVITYGCENMVVSYNTLINVQTGFYIKGSATGMQNSGTISYNLIQDVTRGMRIADVSATTRLVVSFNLITDFSVYGILITSNGADDGRMTDLFSNTIARTSGTPGALISVNETTGTTIRIRDNVLFNDNDSTGFFDAGEYSQPWQVLDYQWHVQNPGTFQASYNGSNATSLAAWRTLTGAEANSTVTATIPFVDAANDDFAVTGAPTTASSTGGPVGCCNGAELPGFKLVSGL